MPKVPKSQLDPESVARGDPGLLDSPDTKPDATSIMMAAAMMRGQAGPRTPHRSKAPKGSGHTKPMLK